MAPKNSSQKWNREKSSDSLVTHIEGRTFKGRPKNYAEKIRIWDHREPREIEALMNIELRTLFKSGFYSNSRIQSRSYFGGDGDTLLKLCQDNHYPYYHLEQSLWSIITHLNSINNLGPGGKAALTLAGRVCQAFIHGGRCYLRMSSFNHLKIHVDPKILPPSYPKYPEAAFDILRNYEPLVRLAICLLGMTYSKNIVNESQRRRNQGVSSSAQLFPNAFFTRCQNSDLAMVMSGIIDCIKKTNGSLASYGPQADKTLPFGYPLVITREVFRNIEVRQVPGIIIPQSCDERNETFNDAFDHIKMFNQEGDLLSRQRKEGEYSAFSENGGLNPREEHLVNQKAISETDISKIEAEVWERLQFPEMELATLELAAKDPAKLEEKWAAKIEDEAKQEHLILEILYPHLTTQPRCDCAGKATDSNP